MLVERGVVKLGLEIEVADWKPGESYRTTVAELLDKGFMWDDGAGWEEYHTYHCNCVHGGCREVRAGNPIYPKPVVAATYDGSLPVTGAEFITSTIVLADEGMEVLRPVWDIIAGRSVWNNTLPSRNGGPCSPSIHIHVSATSPNGEEDEVIRRYSRDEDYMHVLSLFAPELLAVASSAGVKRGLAFRQPLRYATDNPHHAFIQIRKAIPNKLVYIEWRMFEAMYDDWDYVEACGFLAATVTRGLLSEEIFTQLMVHGYSDVYSMEVAEAATRKNDTDAVLELVSPKRLNMLRDICLGQLDDDEYGHALLTSLFNKTERNIA